MKRWMMRHEGFVSAVKVFAFALVVWVVGWFVLSHLGLPVRVVVVGG